MQERPQWRALAQQYGFIFHSLYGQPYWDETACYQFTLAQVENDIEAPTAELHQMCLHLVDQIVRDDEKLQRMGVDAKYWSLIADSWHRRDPSLYSRMDLVYAGAGPAKLLENNADTPTSLYETGFWQWLWLEQQVNAGKLPRHADQFNSLQEKLVNRFAQLAHQLPISACHFCCSQDSLEDRATVQYLQDCARAAGIDDHFLFMEDIGLSESGHFTDLGDRVIEHCFKLYPWEFIFQESFASALESAEVQWLEPPWKALISNKAILPLLWQAFPHHPNLLPAFFADDVSNGLSQLPEGTQKWIKKPLFSREGANISLLDANKEERLSDGPYGDEGYILQAFQPLPQFADNYTLIGSWLVDDEPAGMSVREDKSLITQDLSRFVPHFIA